MNATYAGRHRRPAGWSVLHVVFDNPDLRFGEDSEAVRDQVNRVAGFAFDLVFRLADARRDADKIANCGIVYPCAQLIAPVNPMLEPRDLIPRLASLASASLPHPPA